jgi:four helix bundle protein
MIDAPEDAAMRPAAKIEKFEDLIAWQKARELVGAVYVATRERDFARDFGLASQVQRSAVSIMANIAEGFERNGMIELRRFLDIARGSCAEVRSHLYVANDIGYLDDESFHRLMLQAKGVARLPTGLHAAGVRSRAARNLGTGLRAQGTPTGDAISNGSAQ